MRIMGRARRAQHEDIHDINDAQIRSTVVKACGVHHCYFICFIGPRGEEIVHAQCSGLREILDTLTARYAKADKAGRKDDLTSELANIRMPLVEKASGDIAAFCESNGRVSKHLVVLLFGSCDRRGLG